MINQDVNTKYNEFDTKITGIIEKIKISNNKMNIELKGKEKIIINYYYHDINEVIYYKLGMNITVSGVINRVKKNSNFNLFNYKLYLYSKKIYWIFEADEILVDKSNIDLIYQIKNNVINRINKIKTSTYLKLFILGDYDIEDDIEESFRINGISHLFSVSGMNIVLFIAILEYILKKNKMSFIIIFMFLFLYLFLTNNSIPVMRAVYFYIFLTIKKKFNLNISNIKIFVFLMFLFLLYNPFYIYNIGFLFTFLITLSLLAFSRMISSYESYISKLFITSLISFLISIPIVINNFFEINLLSPIINLFFVPYVSFIIFPLALINFLIPEISFILTFFINILEGVSLLVSKIDILIVTLSKVNFLFFISYYILILFVIKKIEDKKYLYISLILISIFIHSNINYFNMNPKITFIDQTTPNMIQRISGIFQRNPLISMGI